MSTRCFGSPVVSLAGVTRTARPRTRGAVPLAAATAATFLVAWAPVGVAAAATTGSATAGTSGTLARTVVARAERTPLLVSIDTLAPATIPSRGRVTLTGQVTNRSKETWTDLNVYLLTSAEPLRSRGSLAEAAGGQADAPVGSRLTGAGLFVRVDDLAPGRSASYRLSVRRADLGVSGAPGVYWVGVHVLGQNADGRDAIADARARTFMPLLPTQGSDAGARTRLALVVPLHRRVQRTVTGRLADPVGWERSLAADGRLGRVLGLSGRATRPITWVVDPAVLDAARSMAEGNPELDTSPSDGSGDGTPGNEAPDATPAPTPTPSPADAATESPPTDSPPTESPPTGTAAASPDRSSSTSPGSRPGTGENAAPDPTAEQVARDWLAEFRRQAPGHGVAAVPYGNLDVASALTAGRRSMYREAVGLSRGILGSFGVPDPMPVVDPLDGFLPEAALDRLTPDSVALLREAAFPDAQTPVVADRGRATVVLEDTDAGTGGPLPGSRYDALGVRQRLLSDAALHALSPSADQPLVVSLPTGWDPGAGWPASRFFEALDTPWLQLVDLASVVTTAAPPGPDDPARGPVYPDRSRLAEVPTANLDATRSLLRTGTVYARLLTLNDTVDGALARMAMLASSYHARPDPVAARTAVLRTDAAIRSRMMRVRVEGPPFVMMSGQSGPIQVTLVNGLERQVTVGLRVRTPGSDLRVAPVAPVTLGPGRRMSVRLEASSADIGVHSVRLMTTDAEGVPLGSTTQFSVRTSHVSTVIWVIIAAGGGLLLLAVVIRLVRRVRRRKAGFGPLLPHDDGPPPPTPARS